ncbi:MAG TPA: YetF domain-containing protein [Nitrospiraceae bacterium]|nr:YetF domain-containing protein [Nitrospiraceae bacterium]
METVLRATAVYLILVLVFRLAGRRTFAQMTNFDLILLLIISEASQNAMTGNDYSITNGFFIIVTLVGIDVGLSLWKQHSPRVQRWLDGLPMIVVEDGRLLKDRMDHCRLDEDDILSAARERQGLERVDQIKYAVLETSGGISIIPKQ